VKVAPVKGAYGVPSELPSSFKNLDETPPILTNEVAVTVLAKVAACAPEMDNALMLLVKSSKGVFKVVPMKAAYAVLLVYLVPAALPSTPHRLFDDKLCM
jgi:hypothetical protein